MPHCPSVAGWMQSDYVRGESHARLEKRAFVRACAPEKGGGALHCIGAEPIDRANVGIGSDKTYAPVVEFRRVLCLAWDGRRAV